MGENELYKIASHFREAIVAVKTNGEFDFRDRMHRFPNGCCDVICLAFICGKNTGFTQDKGMDTMKLK